MQQPFLGGNPPQLGDSHPYSSVKIAFLLTFVAGLSTTIGGILVTMWKSPSNSTVGKLEAFSAGVMILLSVEDLLLPSFQVIRFNYCCFGFICGALLYSFISVFVPDPVQAGWVSDIFTGTHSLNKAKNLRLGIVTSIGICIHNFPEGVSVYVSSLKDAHLGISLALGIAIHNIPEGITVAAPIYHATNNRKQALLCCFLSGMFEPFGALVAYLCFQQWMTDFFLHFLLSLVAGTMTMISVQELLPSAVNCSGIQSTLWSFLLGVLLCQLNLWILPPI